MYPYMPVRVLDKGRSQAAYKPDKIKNRPGLTPWGKVGNHEVYDFAQFGLAVLC